jgi:hypothetical protein
MYSKSKKSVTRNALLTIKTHHILLIVLMLLIATAMTACGEETKTESSPSADKPASSEGSGGSGSSAEADACKIVTQEDATKLFGKPAVAEEGSPVFDTKMVGECLWTWDTETGNQLLQFRIWDGEMYYSDSPNSQPIDIGEKGNIVMNEFLGVDITWLQDGKTYTLSYSTTGSGVPEATDNAEEVKILAKKVEGQV